MGIDWWALLAGFNSTKYCIHIILAVAIFPADDIVLNTIHSQVLRFPSTLRTPINFGFLR